VEVINFPLSLDKLEVIQLLLLQLCPLSCAHCPVGEGVVGGGTDVALSKDTEVRELDVLVFSFEELAEVR